MMICQRRLAGGTLFPAPSILRIMTNRLEVFIIWLLAPFPPDRFVFEPNGVTLITLFQTGGD
jgi:hypothetical protein